MIVLPVRPLRFRPPLVATVLVVSAWLGPSLGPSVVLAQAPAPAAAARAAQFYEDGLRRFEAKDYKGAIIQLKNALTLDKTALQVMLLMGKALLADGQVAAAEVALTDALRLGVARAEVVLPLAEALVQQGRQSLLLQDPRFEVAGLAPGTAAALHLLRAGAQSDLSDHKAALASIAEARRLQPSIANSWIAEVPVRIRAGELDAARTAADRALAIDAKNGEALHMRGQVEHAAGRLAEAIRWYDRSVAASPNHLDVLVARAGVLLDVGRLDDARKDVEATLKASPGDPRATYLLALLSERQGQGQAARAAYNEVTAKLDPVPPEFLRYRPQLLMLGGMAHYSLQQPEKALPYLEQVQRLQPASPVSKVLARIQVQTGNEGRAVEVLESYLRQVPRDEQAMLLLASIHMSGGRFARAIQVAQAGLGASGQSTELRSILGMSLLGAGQYAAAAAELERVVKADPRRTEAGSSLTTLYLQSGQTDKALRVAQTLLQASPRHPALHVLMADVQRAGGQAAAARKSYEKALELRPGLAGAEVGLARLDKAAGQVDAAVRRIDAVLRRDANHLEAMALLAALNEDRGRLDDARRLYERVDELAGMGNVQTSLALVDFHLRHGQAEGAREALARATAKAPDAVPTLLAATRVQLALGRDKEARTMASRAAARAGFDVPTLMRVAQLQLQAGHAEGAAHSLDKALTQRQGDPLLEALRAEAALRAGDAAQAEQRARRLIASAPRLGIGHALMGDIAASAGKPRDAVGHYRTAYQVEPGVDYLLRLHDLLTRQDPAESIRLLRAHLRKQPQAHAVRRALADAEARSGDYAAARRSYEQLDREAGPDADVLNNLAQVMLLQRDPAALAVAERALKLRPGASHVIGTTGWAAFQAGQVDRAITLLRDARLRDPNHPSTRFYLGSALAKAGRSAEARSELQAALELDAGFAHAAQARELLAGLR